MTCFQFQALAAGHLEAFATRDILYDHWRNTIVGYCDGKEELCKAVKEYLKLNRRYIEEQIRKTDGGDPFWHQVRVKLSSVIQF